MSSRGSLTRVTNASAGWMAASVALLYRRTLTFAHSGDPRASLHARRHGYAVAFLHAHQIGGVLGVDRPIYSAMVSASNSGELLIPILRCLGIGYARGSSRKKGKDKGGARALVDLTDRVSEGGAALLAIDGPQGPRNRVHHGVATLAHAVGVPILPVVVIPSRRWILEGTWDRMQVPMPFSCVTYHWAKPIWPEGREVPELRDLTQAALDRLEHEHDPGEAASCAVER